MAKLALTHYERKGIYAYLAPVSLKNGTLVREKFINGSPVDKGDNKNRFYAGKSSTVEIDLAALPDRYYEWKEADGHRSSTGFVLIRDGEIAEDVADIYQALSPLPELPPLTGTQKQVSWAESIRAKAARMGKAVPYLTQTSAQFWIDNRSKFE